ncbi:psbP domain-containing protein 1, chloroplastic [Dorcoceras hygrometricum]|uniref:PsbP domain-containing protein 1, chloroplastic n=1 Tax=Dorcoceras hygrometricum TaxID=472368 RepID=A0A2Z7AE93_9LAMI|nr:psbP domain-containing protein 1, chloroplastic [Dorcoceras hygrometricum]
MISAFRTARNVSGMRSCTVPEKPVGSDLEYADRFVCPDQLWALDQIAYWKQHGAYQHVEPPLSAGRHSLRGQLSLRMSTRLSMVNSARGGQLILEPRNSLRLESNLRSDTACNLTARKQLAICPLAVVWLAI